MLPCVKLQAASLKTVGLSNMPWISHNTSLKGREHAATFSTGNELLGAGSGHLDRGVSIPQKREQFHNKSECATTWSPLQRSNQHDCVTQSLPKQRALLHHTHLTVCAADSTLTNTQRVRKVHDEVVLP